MVGSDTQPWTYDAGGKLFSVPGVVTSAAYEADGQTTEIAYSNGVRTRFFYNDNRRWLREIDTHLLPSTQLLRLPYERDNAGRIESVDSSRAREDFAYTYDDLDRLLSATNLDGPHDQAFTYNSVGNMLSSPLGNYAYPAQGENSRFPHAPTAADPRAYSYTANGNVISDGTKNFVGDAFDHLTRETSANVGFTRRHSKCLKRLVGVTGLEPVTR